MHFALPGRNHRSSPFPPGSVPRAYFCRRRPLYAVVFLAILLLIAFARNSGDGKPAGAPDTVMILLADRIGHSTSYINKVIDNRKEYAEVHGYGLFVANVTDYPIGEVPNGWACIPAIRHAMKEYKYSTYFWFLDQDAVIMNPSLSLEQHILAPERLGSIMRRGVPVVPSSSIIETYKHVPPERVQFVITQDAGGLQPGSMILKAGPWAHYLLDAWFDPIFRYYGFQKAEQHALEHIVQWHPTVLTKLALVPQKIMNSYPNVPGLGGIYEDGDLLVRLRGCAEGTGRSCEKEFQKYLEKRTPLK
ncbi:Glycosyltransferase Family 34 protein [Tuber magnatum]|uniref:Glycosyltransferase Family 34 protein n=1 Tax=Tuber magnatum TaxID=42249 RepID=A0A317ST65_9PEZI|nr:Glycosyltransferase Family 34 protein [Tuber magnatum]